MEVVIALDDYEDIFDDFDIRPYGTRNISADFLHEVLSRIKNIPTPSKLILTLPKYKRVKKDEKKIAQRLKLFFKERAAFFKERREALLKKALIFIVIGLIFSYVGYVVYAGEEALQFVAELFFVGTYFFVWNGFSYMFFSSRRLEEKNRIYAALEQLEIVFENEEKIEKHFNNKHSSIAKR